MTRGEKSPLLPEGTRMSEVDVKESYLQKFIAKVFPQWKSMRTVSVIEGLDFEPVDSLVNLMNEEKNREQHARARGLTSWIVCSFIAIIVGLVAVFVDVSIQHLHGWSFKVVNENYLQLGATLAGFGTLLWHNLLFVFIAALLVTAVELRAKGSGVPEIKSYLNGRKIHRVLSVRAMLSKVGGVIFSVAGNMVVGKEGPMIHSGAIVAGELSQGRFSGLGYHGNWLLHFRNDRRKRDFVSIGCACGVAAAFGSPIGGVLFVIEEAASYWRVELTWRTFFATMLCSSTVNFMLTGISKESGGFGMMTQSAVISFGSFEGASKDPKYPEELGYMIGHMPLFIVIGVLGGVLGGLFNHINTLITIWRQKNITNGIRRMIECLAVVFLTTAWRFLFAFMGSCQKIGKNDNLELDRFTCAEGEYNTMSPLFNVGLDSTVHNLFHSTTAFGALPLFACFVSFFMLSCITYGVSIPSGIFVPSIVVGSALGRLLGEGIAFIPGLDVLPPGTWALIGGAAFLGGVTRVTISIVVIIVETTNNITYAIPIMLTIMTSKLVGDRLTHGLYDIHINLQKIDFLEDEPEKHLQSIRASDLMSKSVSKFRTVERVGNIYETLKRCKHNGFPVVDPEKNQSPRWMDRGANVDTARFEGIILRSQLLVLLQEKPFMDSKRSAVVKPDQIPAKLSHETKTLLDESEARVPNLVPATSFNRYYPRFPKLSSISLTQRERECYIDLSVYMNASALTVHHSTKIERIHLLFRAMGLRHLTVVNSLNHVVGILTRHDLNPHSDDFRGHKREENAADDIYTPFIKPLDPQQHTSMAQSNIWKTMAEVTVPEEDDEEEEDETDTKSNR